MIANDNATNQQIPFLPGTIGRPRLHKQLEDSTSYKLTLVSAPPGYGKTTLVAEFARATATPVLWHSVESRERDVPNLMQHCIQVLKHRYPAIDKHLLINEINTSNGVIRLCEYLGSIVTEDILYVLDDVHSLMGVASAEEWLRTLVEYVPPRVHLIMISRIVPTLPLTEMIARREVMAIGTDQLRFRIDEIEELASLIETKHPASLLPEELALHLEGWPAGTVLALQPLPKDVQQSVLKGKQGPEGLFDILAESVFNRELPRMRHFLLATSVVSHFSPDICSKALGIEDSHALVIQALNRNLFVSRVSGGLVYHRLFRDFLQRILREQHAHRYEQLNIQVADWYLTQNQLEEAFEHYIIAGCYDEAIAIVEEICNTYYAQGKLETLLAWRETLGQFISHAPWLVYNCAKIHTDRYEYDNVEEELHIAEEAFQTYGNQLGYTEVILQRCRLRLRRGQPNEVIETIQGLLEASALEAHLQARAIHMLGLALIQQSKYMDAVAYLQQASSYYESIGDQYALASVLQDTEVAYLHSGRLDEASVCLQRVVALWRALGRDDTLALAINNLGYHYHQRGNYKQALLTLEEGRLIAERARNRRAETYICSTLADLQRDVSDFQEALQNYQRTLELNANREPNLHCVMTLNLSTLYRWHGSLNDAEYLAEEAEALAIQHDFKVERLMAEALLYCVDAEQGNAQVVLPKLHEILQELDEKQAYLNYVQVLGMCSEVALICGDESACHRYIKAGYQAKQNNQNIQPLVAEIYHNLPLRRFLKQHRDKYGVIAHDLDLLERSVTTPDTSYSLTVLPTPETTSPFKITVYTLGLEKIERDGVTISTTESRAQRAREFFYYLLFMGAKRREEISLEFWADSSTSQVRSNFHTTLYRIRQALGENIIIYHDDLYMVNPVVNVWCDARELEACVQQARLLPLTDARAEDLWRRATETYKGDLLPSFYSGWITDKREVYYEMYVEALMGTGNCVRARNDFQKAIQIYRQCLSVDPFREDAHRAIMKCYAALGEKKLILLHFENLKDMFARELGVEPSSQTIELAQKLVL